ncbi:MAG: enoyl-CoA hydratase, partial [Marmoricola sp.]|nr:enoyl-CoA hydratase [Marmoricola sp.]
MNQERGTGAAQDEVEGLEVRREAGALWITFARPSAYNALTGGMVAGATAALRDAVTRDDVRVVVLTGSGRAFCAGADLGGEAAHEKYDGGSVDGASLLVRAIIELDKPVVCGLNGVAAGVGVSVALACDLV